MKVEKVLIPGKFEVIHAGHVRLFRMGNKLGKKTIVALDIQQLSNDEIAWRIAALKGLTFIDHVETFNSDIFELLSVLKPEIVLKGKEFTNVHNPESDYLKSFGGKLIFSSGSAYYSDSDLIMKNTYGFNFDIDKKGQEFLSRNNLDKRKAQIILSLIQNIRTCVIGDLIIDEIINCHPVGMSQEEPSIVVTPVDSKKFLGGAGIVAAHCSALGSHTTFVTILGKDENARWGIQKLQESVSKVEIIQDENRTVNLKQRFKSGKQTLLKLNHFSQNPISVDIEKKVLNYFIDNIKKFDLLILSDFSFGVISDNLAASLIQAAQQAKIFVASDSQTSSQLGSLIKFKGSNLITPTELEARLEIRDENIGLVALAESLRKKIATSNILLKLGADGVFLHGSNSKNKTIRTDQVPALNNSPLDLSGAGDSMLAAAALTLACNGDLYMAAFMGSVMSAIQVSQVGNKPISKKDIEVLLSQ